MKSLDNLYSFFELRFKAISSKLWSIRKKENWVCALHEAGHAITLLHYFPDSKLHLFYTKDGAICRYKFNKPFSQITNTEELVSLLVFVLGGYAAEYLHGEEYEDIIHSCQFDLKIIDDYLDQWQVSSFDWVQAFELIFENINDRLDKKITCDGSLLLREEIVIGIVKLASQILVQHDAKYKELAHLFSEKGFVFPSAVNEIWSRDEVR